MTGRERLQNSYRVLPFLALVMAVPFQAFGGNTPPMVELSPERSFSLTERVHRSPWKSVLVLEMRATPDTLWFLVTSKEQQGRVAIIGLDYTGQLRSLIDLPELPTGGGLAVTSRGVAIIIMKLRQGFLREYDAKGVLLSETWLPCFSTGNLVAIGGKASVICSDGTITQYDGQNTPVRRSSWARSGSIVEVLSASQVAIVDPSTVQVVLNDLNANTISAARAQSPEIDEALLRTADQRKAAEQPAPPGVPPMGRPVIAMDTASDASGWYILIYPYQPDAGPAVAKFDYAGQLLGRFRCRPAVAKPNTSWYKIEAQNGHLILASGNGDFVLYKP